MTNYFDKILFLKKSNSSLEIIYLFLITKIKNILFKSKIKNFKKQNKDFLKKKIVTFDYFSSHSYYFYSVINNKDFKNVLEIGSFEGNSSMFFARNLRNTKIFCVDSWIGTEEYKNLNFKYLENNFDKNTKEYKNVYKFKCTSDEFFKKNDITFDLIYIDGYHKAEQVMKDFRNAWQSLNNKGILIFDDYIWKFFDNIKDNPCYAINFCLSELKKQYKVLKVTNSQLFIQKIQAY